MLRRPPQRRQVDPDQRPGGPEGRDHLEQAADDPAHHPRHRHDRTTASSCSSTRPGLHKPRTLLGERLNDLVRETLLEVDVIGFCLPADQRIGPGDQFIARELAEVAQGRGTPVVAIATKSDTVDRQRLAEHLIAVDQLGDWAEIVPCSATKGSQVDVVGAGALLAPAALAGTAVPGR